MQVVANKKSICFWSLESNSGDADTGNPQRVSRKERVRSFKDKHCKTFDVTWRELWLTLRLVRKYLLCILACAPACSSDCADASPQFPDLWNEDNSLLPALLPGLLQGFHGARERPAPSRVSDWESSFCLPPQGTIYDSSSYLFSSASYKLTVFLWEILHLM